MPTATKEKISPTESDEEGMKTMAALGQNGAWLLKKINGQGN